MCQIWVREGDNKMINIAICLNSTEYFTKDFAYYATSVYKNSLIDILDDDNIFRKIDIADENFIFVLNATNETLKNIETKYTIRGR